MNHSKRSQIDESVAREQRLNRVRGASTGSSTIIGVAGGTNDSLDHMAMSGALYGPGDPTGVIWTTSVDDDLVIPEGIFLMTVLAKFNTNGGGAMDGYGEIVTAGDSGRFRLVGSDILTFEITMQAVAGVFAITCPVTGTNITPSVNCSAYMHGFPA